MIPVKFRTRTPINKPPVIKSIVRFNPTARFRSGDVTLRIQFSELVENVTLDDFELVHLEGNGISDKLTPSSLQGIRAINAGLYEIDMTIEPFIIGQQFTVFNGDFQIRLRASNDIQDMAGNALTFSQPNQNEFYTNLALHNWQFVAYNYPQVVFNTEILSFDLKSDRAVTLKSGSYSDYRRLTGSF